MGGQKEGEVKMEVQGVGREREEMEESEERREGGRGRRKEGKKKGQKERRDTVRKRYRAAPLHLTISAKNHFKHLFRADCLPGMTGKGYQHLL